MRINISKPKAYRPDKCIQDTELNPKNNPDVTNLLPKPFLKNPFTFLCFFTISSPFPNSVESFNCKSF